MFEEHEMLLLDNLSQSIGSINGTIQPYEKKITFEDSIEIELTARVYCETHPKLKEATYIKVEEQVYRPMVIKAWSDRCEIQLYACGRSEN